VASGIRHL
jgi:hypothetical protein